MSKVSASSTTSPWTLTTPRIVTAGALSAITIILGVVPYLGFIPLPFAALARFNRNAAAATAGFVGSATNTVLVLTMAVWRGYIPLALIVTIIPQAVAEAVIAAIITTILASAFFVVQGRLVRAPEKKSRDQLHY